MLRAFFARAAAVAALCLPLLGCSSPDKAAERVSSQTEDIGAAGATGGCTVDADCGHACGVCDTATGTCSVATSAVTCRAAVDLCDVPDNCDGVLADCPPIDAKRPNGFTCRSANGLCDLDDTCNGTTDACPDSVKVSGVLCRAAVDPTCDIAEVCDGTSPACPTDAVQPTTLTCRAAAGLCDVPDNCDGSGHCSADAKRPNGFTCRSANGLCDVDDKCNGTTDACPDSVKANGVTCRAAVDATCDIAEVCDGTSPACPNDAVQPATVGCRAAAGNCDVPDNCDGSGHCAPDKKLGPNDPACRPAVAGGCDKPEFCDGTSPTCPATDEKYVPSDNHVCRSANDLCDVAETCPGGTDFCPQDAFAQQGVPCRDAAPGKVCDVADVCPGGTPICPDKFADPSKPCRDAVGKCDITEFCNSTSPDCGPDLKVAKGVVCRAGDPAKTECDPPELCDGSNPACPDAAYKSPGTACNDSVACTQNDACDTDGNCVGVPTKDPALLEATCQTNEHTCASTSCTVSGCKYDKLTGLVCRPKNGICDIAEACDGSSIDCPADAFQPATFTCQSLACTNATLKPAIQCSGSAAACPTVADTQCGNYACGSTTDCRTTCVTSDDCGTAFYCLNNACVPRIGAGQACKTDAECSTSNNHCVDGVCCDTTCTGQCEACNTVGKVGTCVGVKGDPVAPRMKCTADGTKCDGFCDPSNRSACQFPNTATSCSDALCNSTTNAAEAESFCTGKGACNKTKPTDCEPYSCGATACNGDCTADAQCAADAYCASGKCTKKGKQADACTTDKQCGSGHCADGVCCDTACTGQCEACNKVPDGKVGTCSPVSGKPLGDRTACASTTADPECGGACDGKNRLTCNYPGQGTVCRDGTCADGQATVASYCNGHGACPAAFTISCAKGCEGTLCAGDQCILDGDCKDPSKYCAAGACTPKADPGSSCSSASACKSGFCTDGVCCDSACLGQCEACDTSGSVGTCSAVPKGDSPHGGRTSCVSDGSACGGSCDGAARNACKYPFDNVCRNGSCAPGASPGDPATSIVEATCIGNGRCPGEQQQLCGNDGCDRAAKVCNGACAVDKNACKTGEYCAAGECVPKLPPATVCANDAQCGSGYCVDGVCCNKRCADECAACDVPGSVGTCTPVTGAAHGGRAACGGVGTCGAACDGKVIAACSFADDSVSCGDAFCSAGLKGAAPVCDGAGVCAPAKTTACKSLACDGAECSTVCSADADCVKNFECRKGQCVPPVLIDAVDKGTCGCSVPGSGSGVPSSCVLALLGACALGLSRRRRRLAA